MTKPHRCMKVSVISRDYAICITGCAIRKIYRKEERKVNSTFETKFKIKFFVVQKMNLEV